MWEKLPCTSLINRQVSLRSTTLKLRDQNKAGEAWLWIPAKEMMGHVETLPSGSAHKSLLLDMLKPPSEFGVMLEVSMLGRCWMV